MKIHRLLFILFVVATSVAAVAAQNGVKQIDALMSTYFNYGQFNGAVLVAENGKVVYKKGFGMANIEWSIPIEPDTKFRIGSVTKQFTATLILQLVEEGKIKLDGKLSDYLPYYRKDTGSRVTIHQLLNHTSGIPSYTNSEFFRDESRNPYKPDDFVKKFASGDLEFEPGSKYSYNNSGYFILGAIIERLTGKTYAAVLKERIFTPLGMTDTGYDNAAPIIMKRAAGYQKLADGFVNAAYLDMSLPYAAGSMYSTVEDLFKWDQALYADKILSAESKRKMFTPGFSNYGYGFDIVDREIGKSGQKTKFIQHGGGINGFTCLLTRLVDKNQTVIILDNVGLGDYHEKITDSIVSILNGQPFEMPKRSVGEHVYKIVRDKGVEAAIAEYRKLKTSNANDYDFSEEQLNSLGYELLTKQRFKDAIAIFRLNVEMFPNSGNAYDSLGEAYLADNQKEPALENYKKAVALNPSNANAVAVINRLEGKTAPADPSSWPAYVGEYELGPSFILAVFVEGDKLVTQATGQGKIPLEPAGDAKFVVTALNASITFEKGEDGKITGLTLVQNGRTIKAKKIK